MKPLALASPVAFGLAFLCLVAVPGTAQNQTWIRQFGKSGVDRAYAAAPDGSGGVFLGGETGGLGRDAWLAHYDGVGDNTWTVQLGFSNAFASAAATDGSGGVYVGGFTVPPPPSGSSGDIWFAHYDGTGNRTWNIQFVVGSGTGVAAAAPDGAGGFFMAGHTIGSLGAPSAGGVDAWLAHYDNAGNRTWIRQFGSSNGDTAYAAATDGAGGVYLGGGTNGNLGGPSAGSNDAWVAHYDSVGNQTWMRQFGSTGDDHMFAAAPDGSGGVYLAGETNGTLGGSSSGVSDGWVAHYDSGGNQTWVRQFGTSDYDSALTAAPDGSGGVHVGGLTAASLGGPNAGSLDAWLARYDAAGNQAWIRQIGTSSEDIAYAAATDGSEGVYLGGSTGGNLGGPNAGQDDAWLARYIVPPAPTLFCTAKTTLVCGPASISAVGSASAAATKGFVISAQPVRGCRAGLLLYSDQPPSPALPFGGPGNGLLCMFFGIRRAGPIESGGTSPQFCDGVLSIDMNQFHTNNWTATGCSPASGQTSPAGFLSTPGTTVNAQMWGRDSIATGQVLSDGISWTVGP